MSTDLCQSGRARNAAAIGVREDKGRARWLRARASIGPKSEVPSS
jgi:hypothetical protein